MDWSGSSLRGERPATNRLSHDMAFFYKKWKYFLSTASRFPEKNIALLESSQTSLVCPSGKSNIKWQWVWSTGGMILTGETEVLQQKSVPMPLFHHKAHTKWPGIEIGPPRRDAGNQLPEP
jgi:hypothetical protein